MINVREERCLISWTGNLHTGVPIVPGIAELRARDCRSHVSEENGKISCVKYYWRPANAGESRWGWRGIRSSRLDGTRECAREWHATGFAERLTREIKKKKNPRVHLFPPPLPSSFFVFLPLSSRKRKTPALPRCVTVRGRFNIGFKYRKENRFNVILREYFIKFFRYAITFTTRYNNTTSETTRLILQ